MSNENEKELITLKANVEAYKKLLAERTNEVVRLKQEKEDLFRENLRFKAKINTLEGALKDLQNLIRKKK